MIVLIHVMISTLTLVRPLLPVPSFPHPPSSPLALNPIMELTRVMFVTDNGWLKANPIPAAKASYGIGEKVTESNKRIIQTILAHPPSRALPSADQTNLQHLRSFYTSCMNETRINEERSKPIIALVEKLIEGWRGSRQDRKSDQEDGFIVQQEEASSIYDGLREKQGKDGDRDRWNPATRKERLTAALSFLHSRGVFFLLLVLFFTV